MLRTSRESSFFLHVLVLGDSVGITLFPGLKQVARDHGLALTLGIQIGCPRDSTEPGCPPPWEAQIARLRPDVVLLVDSGIWSLFALRVGGQVARIGSPAWDEAWLARRQELVDGLLAAGARRLAITTMPCIEDGSIRDARRRLSARNLAHANVTLSALAARNPERVQLIDLAGYVCPSAEYQRSLGPVATVRRDGVHYSAEGADLVGRWLAPRLARAGAVSNTRDHVSGE